MLVAASARAFDVQLGVQGGPFLLARARLRAQVHKANPAVGRLRAQHAQQPHVQRLEGVGRVLRPPGLAPYRIREEEVARTGAKVIRAVRRTRWTDGSTHLWISRRRRAGTGEAASGLRYDLADSTKGGG